LDVVRILGIRGKLRQQRVAIARAIVNRPAILLADEPTENLDKKFGQTVLMITRDPEAAAFADRTVQMRDGLLHGA